MSLDIKHQGEVVNTLDGQRRAGDIAVVMVTHEINPMLPVVDRVLYLAGSRWAIGTPDEVLTSATLSQLYKTTVEVLRVQGRIVIVGAPEAVPTDQHHDTAPAR